MKEILEIEIERPSKTPTVFTGIEPALKEAQRVEVHVLDGILEGAVYVGFVRHVKDIHEKGS